MSNRIARPSADTLGLVVVKRALEPNPLAECYGHEPTRIVTTLHETIAGETVGELLARLGMDEGDEIAIRFPTVAEDRDRLAKLIDAARYGSNVEVAPNGSAIALRDDDGAIVGEPDDLEAV